MPHPFDNPPAATRRAVDYPQPPAPQAQRADYVKLVVLLAMVFLPWAAIAYGAKLLSEIH